jgi:hypothetical protein
MCFFTVLGDSLHTCVCQPRDGYMYGRGQINTSENRSCRLKLGCAIPVYLCNSKWIISKGVSSARRRRRLGPKSAELAELSGDWVVPYSFRVRTILHSLSNVSCGAAGHYDAAGCMFYRSETFSGEPRRAGENYMHQREARPGTRVRACHGNPLP